MNSKARFMVGVLTALAMLLLSRHATVTICHSRTEDLGRITAEELKTKIDAGEQLVIVDLRHELDFEADPTRFWLRFGAQCRYLMRPAFLVGLFQHVDQWDPL